MPRSSRRSTSTSSSSGGTAWITPALGIRSAVSSSVPATRWPTPNCGRCWHGHDQKEVAMQMTDPLAEIWIDVGAHLGEKTFTFAQENPALRVYAFEPNLQLAAQRLGRLPNFVVMPMAVSEQDGCADFYLNAFAAASSLLPFDSAGLIGWRGGEVLKVERKVVVPTIRLDTFLDLMGIADVHFLKSDA